MTFNLKLVARTSRPRTRYAICIERGEYAASLEPGKVYRVIPDRDAGQLAQLRVLDESGEDYLFPARYFRLVNLSPGLRRLLRAKAVA